MHTGIEHGYRIHVALNDDGTALLLDGAVRAVEAKEQFPLVEEDRLRRVEVLRRRIVEDAAAEADDTAALIRYGDDHAPAEAVVEAAALLALGGQAACQQKLLLDSTFEKSRGQLIPGRRCIAELEFLDCLLTDAAPGEVGLAPLPHARHRQAVVEEVARELIDLAQVLYLAFPRDLLRTPLPLRQGDAQLLCLQLDRVKIRDVFDKRNELERIAAGMAAEAVEEALIGYDREGCRLLVMERAAPPVAIAPALKRDVALHDAHDVCVLAHALDEGVHRLIPHSFQLIPSSRPPLEPDGTHRSDTLVYSLSSGKNLLRADKKLVQPP